MSPNDGNGYLHTVLAGVGGALLALGTWAWNMTHKRIDMVAEKADSFMTKTDLQAHITYEEKRLDKIDQQMIRIYEKFDETEKDGRVRHDALVDGHTKILVALESLKK